MELPKPNTELAPPVFKIDKSKVMCPDHSRNNCRKAQCDRRHDFTKEEYWKSVRCMHWRAGRCVDGNSCKRLHSLLPSKDDEVSFHTACFVLKQALLDKRTRLLHVFHRGDARDFERTNGVRISDLKYVSSYNWLDRVNNQIIVPSAPGILSLPPIPHNIRPDTCEDYLNQNHASSLSNLFIAVVTMQSFNFPSIGLVTDLQFLCRIFDFVAGKKTHSWRINIEVLHQTMFFANSDLVPEEDSPRYQHELQQACTTYAPTIACSQGHFRIISYDFGGIKCLVRYKADAYTDENPWAELADPPPTYKWRNDLIKKGSNAAVLRRGFFIPEEDIVALHHGCLDEDDDTSETRQWNPLPKSVNVAPFYFSQIQTLITTTTTTQSDGNLCLSTPFERYNTSSKNECFANGNQENLKQMAALINSIKYHTLKKYRDRSFLRFDSKSGRLELWGRSGQGGIVLPRGVREFYWKKVD